MKIRILLNQYRIQRIIPAVGMLQYFVANCLYSDSAETLYIANGAFVLFALITVTSIMLGNGMFTIENIATFLPFVIFGILSAVSAINFSIAFQKAITLVVLIFMVVLINNCVKSGRLSINIILFCLMIAGLAVAVSIVMTYGYKIIIFGIVQGIRVGADVLQLNYLGRYTYYGAVLSFYFAYYKNKPLLYLIFVVTTIVCIASGSRQAIIALIIVILMLFMMKDFSRKKIYFIIKLLIAITVFFVIIHLPGLESIRRRVYSGLTVLFTQSSIVSSDMDRMRMIEFGFQTFIKNPIFGIGLGNIREVVGGTAISDRSYLHNNYVELLACGGIVGFIAYYYIYYRIFALIKCRVANLGWSHETIVSLALIIGQLVLDLFAVNYYSKVQYIVFAFAFLALKYDNQINMHDSGICSQM